MTNTSSPRRKWLWIGISAVVLVAGYFYWRSGKQDQATKIETEEVARGDLRETITSTGQLQALGTVPIGAQVSGMIDKIYVDFNDKVKVGQLLAMIDPTVLDAQLDSSRASLSQATVRYQDAQAALKEGEELLSKKFISDREIRTLKVNVTSTKAQLDSATADFERAKRNRQYAEIRSSMNGVVIERAVDRGQTVAAGFQTPTLFTIAEDLKRMQIIASVDESQIGSITVEQAATFTVSAFPGKKFSANVKQIRLKPTVTQNVVTYQVVLNVNNDTGELFPGMTATVDFVLKDLKDVLRIPSAALRIQRVPEELMDAESLKRMQEMRARMGGGSSAPGAQGAPGAGGEGGPTAAQIQAMRARMANGGGNGGGRSGFGRVWVQTSDGKLKNVGVKILGSDMSATAVEPMRDDLKPGDKIVTKLTMSAAQQAQTRSLIPGPPGGNRPR